MGQETKLESALLTLCPGKICRRQKTNYQSTSTCTYRGDPDETKSWQVIKSVRLLSHLSALWAPHPTLSILGSRITFQSPTKTIRFGSLKKGSSKIECNTTTTWKEKLFTATSTAIRRSPSSAKTRLASAFRLHPTSRETQRYSGHRMLKEPQSRSPALDRRLHKWSESLAWWRHLQWGSRVHQASG